MTAIGIRLALIEPRVSAAVFFAGGFVPGPLREEARQVTVPLQFLLQWDDEGMDRQSALDLLDAFGALRQRCHSRFEIREQKDALLSASFATVRSLQVRLT